MELRKSNKLEEGSYEADTLVELQLQDRTVGFQMDTGAQVSVLPKGIFEKLKPKPKLLKTSADLVSFTRSKTKPMGKCSIISIHKNVKYHLTFYILDAEITPLLSKGACRLLNLIKFVNKVSPSVKETAVEALTQNYPDVFKGLGCLEGTCS